MVGTSSMDHFLQGMNTQLLVSRSLRGSVCTSYGNNWCMWHQKEYSSCTKCSKTTCLEICGNYKTKLVAGRQDGKWWMSLGDQTPSIKVFKKSIPIYTPTCTLQSALSAQWKASQEMSALYNHNWVHVGTGFVARPHGHRVGCWTHHSSEEQAHISPPRIKAGIVTKSTLKTIHILNTTHIHSTLL